MVFISSGVHRGQFAKINKNGKKETKRTRLALPRVYLRSNSLLSNRIFDSRHINHSTAAGHAAYQNTENNWGKCFPSTPGMKGSRILMISRADTTVTISVSVWKWIRKIFHILYGADFLRRISVKLPWVSGLALGTQNAARFWTTRSVFYELRSRAERDVEVY